MAEAWNVADEFVVRVGDSEAKRFEDEITIDDVKAVARENGMKQFSVKSNDGTELAPSQFPVKQDIVLAQINKAGM